MKYRQISKVIPFVAILMLASPLAADQTTRTDGNLEAKVEAAIRRSPDYGPFDLISFEVTGDTVTLSGDVYRAPLKEETRKAVASVAGVAHVVDSIEVLPLSFEDDRLRRLIFSTIYRDSFLEKYGTPVAAFGRASLNRSRASLAGWRLSLGLEPLGNYAIHVVVKGGRVTLYGYVDNAVDRGKAVFDARGIFGVMAVENRIEVIGRTPAA